MSARCARAVGVGLCGHSAGCCAGGSAWACDVPRAELGRSLVRHFIRRWDARAEELPALLRVAVTHEQARERLAQLFREQVTPALATVCEPEQLPLRAALVSTQTLGLALTRYVLRFEPVVSLPQDVLVEQLGRTLQAYLTGPLERGEPI